MPNTKPLDATAIRHALDHLADKDPIVKQAIADHGYPPPRVREQGFAALVSIIISQQVSTKAAAAIEQRFWQCMGAKTHQAILNAPPKIFQNAGLSRPKQAYVLSLAELIENGEFDPEQLHQMPDNEAIDYLTQLRGFGVWTAKIYLMFSLNRPDIFPEQDLALIKGLQVLYGLAERPSFEQAAELVEHWQPYRTSGSLLIWHCYHQL